MITREQKIQENLFEITNVAMKMVEDKRIDIEDSRQLCDYCIQLSNDFEKNYAKVDWETAGSDYLDTIMGYAEEKILEKFADDVDDIDGPEGYQKIEAKESKAEEKHTYVLLIWFNGEVVSKEIFSGEDAYAEAIYKADMKAQAAGFSQNEGWSLTDDDGSIEYHWDNAYYYIVPIDRKFETENKVPEKKELRVKTPGGDLVVTDKEDPEYPGIYVHIEGERVIPKYFDRDSGCDKDAGYSLIAMIDYNDDVADDPMAPLYAYLYDKIGSDEPTVINLSSNIETEPHRFAKKHGIENTDDKDAFYEIYADLVSHAEQSDIAGAATKEEIEEMVYELHAVDFDCVADDLKNAVDTVLSYGKQIENYRVLHSGRIVVNLK